MYAYVGNNKFGNPHVRILFLGIQKIQKYYINKMFPMFGNPYVRILFLGKNYW